MKNKLEVDGAGLQHDEGAAEKTALRKSILVVSSVVVATFAVGLGSASIFSVQQMGIIRPLLAASAVFILFSVLLRARTGTGLIGELGFIYLAFAMAYTVSPAIKFLLLDLKIPMSFDGLHFAKLAPQPAEMGAHFWRHTLFVFGVALGFLLVRNRKIVPTPLPESPASHSVRVVASLIAMMVGCILVATIFSAPVANYYEHYIRYNHLSWLLRRFVELCLIFKRGMYFVLLALMFREYRKYRIAIYIFVPLVCAYEIYFSHGSRIYAFTILLASICFYHFRKSPIRLKKGVTALAILALVFVGIEVVRMDVNLKSAIQYTIKTKPRLASEFEAVYCTGFHLYRERANGALPPRNWKMFSYDFISLLPFIARTEFHPQYWYSRHYFPYAVVPPTTMGVIAESAIWGGEFDLFIRSLLNGIFFALITNWFVRRKEKWWALAVYAYCYAMCILTLKYSIFNLLFPLSHVLLPSLLLAAVLNWLLKAPEDSVSIPAGPNA